METHHHHVIRCAYCNEEDGKVGCRLNNCHLSQSSADLTEYPEITTCQGCGEPYSFDAGCWSGDIPPWEREELASEEMANLIQAAVDLAHKRIGFGAFLQVYFQGGDKNGQRSCDP